MAPTGPAVLPAVSYRDRKPRDNVASSTVEGSQGVSRNCDCQQQGGREPGWSGTDQPR
jgi:hypothetical protein